MYNREQDSGHGQQSTPEQEQRDLYRRLNLTYANPDLAQSPRAVLLSDYLGTFNALASELSQQEHKTYSSYDDVQENLPHLEHLLLYRQKMALITQRNSMTVEREKALDEQLGPEVTADLPTEDVTIKNEIDLSIYFKRFANIRHDLFTEFSAFEQWITFAQDPKLAETLKQRVPDVLQRRLAGLEHMMRFSVDTFKNVFETQAIKLDSVVDQFKTQAERLKDDIRLQIDIPEKVPVEVSSSIDWLSVLGGDIIQNILRKRKDLGITDKTNLVITGKEVEGGYLLIVGDDGGGFPSQILQDGFREGFGTNSGGEHRAMARHQEIAEITGGKLIPFNRPQDGRVFAEHHIFLPKAA